MRCSHVVSFFREIHPTSVKVAIPQYNPNSNSARLGKRLLFKAKAEVKFEMDLLSKEEDG